MVSFLYTALLCGYGCNIDGHSLVNKSLAQQKLYLLALYVDS